VQNIPKLMDIGGDCVPAQLLMLGSWSSRKGGQVMMAAQHRRW
jgi:hypothetical protein